MGNDIRCLFNHSGFICLIFTSRWIHKSEEQDLNILLYKLPWSTVYNVDFIFSSIKHFLQKTANTG